MATKIYVSPETALEWTDSGGDYVIDLGGIAADGVRVGARGDLGAAAHSDTYAWRFVLDGFDTAPVVGETVDIYVSTSDGTNEDGDVGTADAAGVTVSLPNLMFLGSAVVQTTTAGDNLQVSGIVSLPNRYVSPVIHNNTVDALLSSGDAHKFFLTPMPMESQ